MLQHETVVEFLMPNALCHQHGSVSETPNISCPAVPLLEMFKFTAGVLLVVEEGTGFRPFHCLPVTDTPISSSSSYYYSTTRNLASTFATRLPSTRASHAHNERNASLLHSCCLMGRRREGAVEVTHQALN